MSKEEQDGWKEYCPRVPWGPKIHNGVAYMPEQLLKKAGYDDLVKNRLIDIRGRKYILNELFFLLDPDKPTAWSLEEVKVR